MENENEKKEMSVDELRTLIMGKTEEIFNLGNGVEVTLKELTQSELLKIEQELAKRNLGIGTPVYNTEYKILKMVYALKEFRVNGAKVNLEHDYEAKEKFLKSLGEGVVLGLTIEYTNILGQKLDQIKKKNLDTTLTQGSGGKY